MPFRGATEVSRGVAAGLLRGVAVEVVLGDAAEAATDVVCGDAAEVAADEV